MLVDAKLEEVITGKRGMLVGIEACMQRQCLVSAVTLMFAAIDALAALTRPVTQVETDGEIFRAWIDRFLKANDRLGCSAQDLWGARCGVLHTYSPEAVRAANHGARRIYYRWRGGPAANATRQLPPGALVLNVEDLHAAIEAAIHDYMMASEADAALKRSLAAHLPTLLCYEPLP